MRGGERKGGHTAPSGRCGAAINRRRLNRGRPLRVKEFDLGNVTVIGAQWGDEGKGKIVDWLASRADMVVRFQGGHNAGHTLVVGDAGLQTVAAAVGHRPRHAVGHRQWRGARSRGR